MGKIIDLTGMQYGRLTVINFDGQLENGLANWKCICDCGSIKIVNSTLLRRGKTKSCGCQNTEAIVKRSTKHNLCKTPEYKTWWNIKERCYSTNSKYYIYYGGRGIEMCERWLNSFELFYKDMGPRPSNKGSIDRIDVNGDYTPDNCRWSDAQEQSHNKRLSAKNKTGTSGVLFNNGKYTVRINANKKTIYLGRFTNLEEATMIRKNAEIKYWGKSS